MIINFLKVQTESVVTKLGGKAFHNLTVDIK